MENLALGHSSKMVVLGGSSLNSPRNVTNHHHPLVFGFTTKPISITRRFSTPLRKASVVCEFQSPASTSINKLQAQEKRRNECFASIFSSGGKETSSIAVNPQPPMPPPPTQVGSPLFWIGVGVGFSALFSWAAGRMKKYAMQQAFKTMMGQMDTQNNQFSNQFNSPFTTGSNFPFPVPPPSSPATSPSPVASRNATVDVPVTEVEAPPTTVINEEKESRPKSSKSAFVDVSPGETLQSNPFESFKESNEKEASKDSQYQTQGFQNGAAFKPEFDAPRDFSSSNPILSVEALEKMMEDPMMQKMIYPYLPEEMRNPTTFKWMLQNPQHRQQLQDMLNSMGGNPEWDNRLKDSLQNFDLSSPEVKEQFDQIGLTPEEVISKIMSNPEVAMAFQNPRVQAAIMDCSQNPLSIAKYQNDKEVMDVFNKISELFPGVTGSP
ncbi:protein TIC 40, chloroplastic isoform X2 [Apium graveolens]|uniref:protein TIC 40, chloroplastic isoform X2 n=1 Tax=Apium graveolens TaxID=4045 RepID=UPI003D7A2C40